MTIQAQKPSLTKYLIAGLIGGVIASVINIILLFIGQALLGGPLTIYSPGTTEVEALPAFLVVTGSILPGVVGGFSYWILKRFANKNARMIFITLSIIVFVVMFFRPFSGAVGTVTIWTFQLMHVGAAIPILWQLFRVND